MNKISPLFAGDLHLTLSTVTGTITGPTSLCGLTTATYSIPADIGTDFVWTLPQGMSISDGASTSSISVLVAHPVNNSVPVRVQFATACGGTRSLSLGVSCSDYTNLIPSYCNSSSVSPSQWVDAQSISGATGYKFNIYTSTGVFITAIERSTYFFRFSQMNFTYGATYQVGVQVKQGEVYGTEGSRCTITLSGPPTTAIESTQCGTSILYTDAIYATAVTNATGYKFNVYDVTGTTLVASYESVTNSFSFSQLTGYAFDTTYQVRVQVIRGTEYGVEGTACSITVLKDAPARALSNQDEIKTSMVSEFKAYPNPFTTTFSITPIEGETATLFYQVYDVTGKMIESSAIAANEIAQHTIGDNYLVGMYLVIVRQGANTQTFKMIKQ